jgi:hypothetical protein
MCKSNGMETKEVNKEAKSAFTIAVLFGMWLQKKEQRKRLAKSKITELYSEWISELSKQYED